MVEQYIKKQFNLLTEAIENKDNKNLILLFSLFIVSNALKIALFNYFILPTQTISMLIYKLIMSVFLVIIIFPTLFSFKSRTAFIIIYISQAVYILVNFTYYFYYRSYIHFGQWISLFTEALLSVKHFAAPFNPIVMTAFIDIPFFLLLALKYPMMNNLRNKLRFYTASLLVLSILAVSVHQVYNYQLNRSVVHYMTETPTEETPIVETYGTLTNNLISVLIEKGPDDLSSRLQYGKEQSREKAQGDKLNFVVIQVESMDSTLINQTYHNQYVTPFLHALSQESIYYPYTLSYHMGGGTSDSEFSLLNSVEPFSNYPAIKLANYEFPNSLVNILNQASYRTNAFHGNLGSFYSRDTAFAKMGFNSFFDIAKMEMTDTGWGAPDHEVLNYALSNMKTEKNPFFYYIITMTSHTPFTSARNYYNNPLYDPIEDETVKNYYNTMSYVDQSLSDFITTVRSEFKDTTIFILGDHTPDISTPIYNQSSYLQNGKYFEYVPLMILTPDRKIYKETKYTASFLDISPTILQASGIPYKVLSNGENLIDPPETLSPIPYKGTSYERRFLFQEISKIASEKIPGTMSSDRN